MNPYRNHDFTLRQIQYAVAVAELATFGAAAKAAGVSQPSLSAQVAKLEDVLGQVLFERSVRGVDLTDAGERLLPKLRAALAAAQDVADLATSMQDPLAIPLRVGVIPTIAPYLLPSIVERLDGQEMPAVHWLELQTASCEQLLLAGDLDAALIAETPGPEGLAGIEVGWEPFLVVVPEGHPLQGPVDEASLGAEALMLLDEGHCLRDHTLRQCALPEGRRSAYRATSLATLVQMVGAGLGISVLPASAVPVETARARVRTLPFQSGRVGRSLVVAHRRGEPRSAFVHQLATAVSAAL
jgi:LysR family hydrogen peroxide-inducible transcriptional activator